MTCVTRLIGLLFILDVCAGGVVSIWDEERKFCGSDFENARHLACYGVNSPFKKSHFGQYEEKDNAREEELGGEIDGGGTVRLRKEECSKRVLQKQVYAETY
jgi:hypothetical protein